MEDLRAENDSSSCHDVLLAATTPGPVLGGDAPYRLPRLGLRVFFFSFPLGGGLIGVSVI